MIDTVVKRWRGNMSELFEIRFGIVGRGLMALELSKLSAKKRVDHLKFVVFGHSSSVLQASTGSERQYTFGITGSVLWIFTRCANGGFIVPSTAAGCGLTRAVTVSAEG